MARPLRIEYSNAWYHVMNRGLRHENIYFTREDRHTFLSLLHDISEKYHIQIHAYCLMSNHYHLMVHTPLPNLQRAMRHLGSVYTQRFNRVHTRDGPLFRGRYKSKLVESETYLTRLSRYIHLNPVVAKMALLPEEYEWSSYGAYMKLSKKPKWLYCDEILLYFGSKIKEQRMTNYHAFTKEGVDDDLLEKISSKKTQFILGSDKFIKSIAKRITPQETTEIPGQNQLIKLLQPSLSTIERVTCSYFKVEAKDLTEPRQCLGNMPRRVAIYLAAKNTDYQHSVIANFFCNIGCYGVSQLYRRLIKDQERDLMLSKIIEEIERDLFC
jgi:putative transposase